jgi:hypothetical protein
MADELLIAVFVDYENLAIGVRDKNKGELKMEAPAREGAHRLQEGLRGLE